LKLNKEGEMQLNLNKMSETRRELVASHLRSQINALQGVLKSLENEGEFNEHWMSEDLRRIENMLRQLRKLNRND
jgi:hypothetical protein